MTIREATLADIPQIQRIRNSVRENQLSDPALVSDRDCEEFMTARGKGWVAEHNGRIIGFAIADLQENNIWALFVDPEYEMRGAGRKLHDSMLDWYFSQQSENVWLGTAPNTRAEKFYKLSGWTVIGLHGKGETKFEMSAETWARLGKKDN